MVKPQHHPYVKEMLGKDFAALLEEVAPFIGPRMDICKTKNFFFISVDVAGINLEDLTLKMQQNTLFIEGETHNPYENEKIINYERFYGSFQRKVLIPDICHLDKLQATYERGILQIIIPFYKGEGIEITGYEENHNDSD